MIEKKTFNVTSSLITSIRYFSEYNVATTSGAKFVSDNINIFWLEISFVCSLIKTLKTILIDVSYD